MRFTNRTGATAAGLMVAAVVSVLALLAAPAASAAPIDSRCPDKAFCLFRLANYSGGRAVFTGTDGNLRDNNWDNGSGVVAGSASSMINNTTHSVTLRTLAGPCGGGSYLARARTEDSTFANNSGIDNAVQCLVFG